MKLKSYIFQIALAAVGAGFLGSCEDMREPTCWARCGATSLL